VFLDPAADVVSCALVRTGDEVGGGWFGAAVDAEGAVGGRGLVAGVKRFLR
jgi:hypothetical protein